MLSLIALVVSVLALIVSAYATWLNWTYSRAARRFREATEASMIGHRNAATRLHDEGRRLLDRANRWNPLARIGVR